MTTAELDRAHLRHPVATLADVDPSRTAHFPVLALVTLLATSPGCSLIFVDGPPTQHQRLTSFDCTSSNLAPLIDMLVGGAEGLAVLGSINTASAYRNDSDVIAPAITAAAFVASGMIGLRRVSSCKEATTELALRAAERSSRAPYGAPPARVDPWLAPLPATSPNDVAPNVPAPAPALSPASDTAPTPIQTP